MGAEKLLAKQISIESDPRDSYGTIRGTHTEELIIAICAQIGTDVDEIINNLSEALSTEYAYQCEHIKLSKYINDYMLKKENFRNEFIRINEHIDGGNKLRDEHGEGILAQLAIRKIANDRTRESNPSDSDREAFKTRRKCYIIDSIKNPAELEYLKLVYTDLVYTVGVFSPLSLRVNFLKSKLIDNKDIYELIDKDSGQDKSTGQKVEETFINSDYFLNITNEDKSQIQPKVERFLKLLFDYGVVTPTIEESAMYEANAAAVNSACLSRQVGAAITDEQGNLLSLGWNDVPKFGGGVYTSSTNIDCRCYNFGKGCSNDKKKNDVVESITGALLDDGIISDDQIEQTKLVIMKNGIKGLIEFARSIHAEMYAIIRGSQISGDKMIGGKLFCTTYPCHNCARHIILAGIKEVYYIEPYKKSLCTELHSDAICDGNSLDHQEEKVKIIMYEGVAPQKYVHFFRMNDNRKNKAKSDFFKKNEILPKQTLTLRAIHELESVVCRDIEILEILD